MTKSLTPTPSVVKNATTTPTPPKNLRLLNPDSYSSFLSVTAKSTRNSV